MSNSNNRVTIREELMSRSNLKANQKVDIFFDHLQKRLLLLPSDDLPIVDMYFVTTNSIDAKRRVFIPKCIRDIFPEASYLPVERDGEIYILII